MNANWSTCKLRDIADVRVSNVDKKTSDAETPVKLCNYMDVYANDYVTRSIDFMAASASRSEIERFHLQAWETGYFESCISGSPKNGIYKPQSAYGEQGTPIVRIDGFGHGDRIKAQPNKNE